MRYRTIIYRTNAEIAFLPPFGPGEQHLTSHVKWHAICNTCYYIYYTTNRVSPVVMYLPDDPFDADVCLMYCPWHGDSSSCTGTFGAFPRLSSGYNSKMELQPALSRLRSFSTLVREPFSDFSSFSQPSMASFGAAEPVLHLQVSAKYTLVACCWCVPSSPLNLSSIEATAYVEQLESVRRKPRHLPERHGMY